MDFTSLNLPSNFVIDIIDNQFYVLIFDINEKIIYINKNFKEFLNVLGFQNKDFQNLSDIFSEKSLLEIRKDINILIETKNSIINKVDEIEVNSVKLHLRTSRFFYHDSIRKIDIILSLSENIEERKKLIEEVEILKNEKENLRQLYEKEKMFFDALMENLPDVIYFKDKDSRIIRCSRSHAKLFKLNSPEEMIGKTDFDYFTYEHASEAYEDEQNIIKTGKPILNKIEKETHPDGSITWAITNKLPLYDKEGNIIGTFGISKDITERYNMEQEIKRKNELLKMQEEELRIQKEELELINEELNKINTDLEEKNEEIKKQALLLEQQKEELLKLNNDLSLTNVILEERQQQIEEQAERLRQQTEELHKQQRKLLEMNNELRKLNATKDKFFSIIAHDIKNPFHTILGFSELLFLKYNNLNEEKRKKYIETIYLSSVQLYKLLENLLQWSRSQLGFIEINKEPINVKELIESNLIIFKEQSEKKNINILSEIPDNLNVFGDINLMNTVVRNLISNAIKFTENGEINISAKEEENNMISISFKDSGIGIPEDKIKTLFDLASVKSVPGTRGETGTGLGLILCKEFIEKMNGKIEVYSKEGQGTNFKIFLPAFK